MLQIKRHLPMSFETLTGEFPRGPTEGKPSGDFPQKGSRQGISTLFVENNFLCYRVVGEAPDKTAFFETFLF